MSENKKEEFVDFDIVKENWSIYEVEDGSKIRIRVTITNMIYTGEELEDGTKGVGFQVQNQVSVYSPPELRGNEKAKYSAEELEKFVTKPNLMYRQIKNGGPIIYETEKSRLIVKNTVTQIDKTSKFDLHGNPAYIVRSNTDIFSGPKDTPKE